MRILVTGAGGFLGRHLALALKKRGHGVVALVRRPVRDLQEQQIECVLGDIRQPEVVQTACRGCQAVIHVAARTGLDGTWREFYAINVAGTQNVLHAAQAAGVERFVYTSSPSVTFAGAPQRGVDESAPYPRRWLAYYPRSKALAEQAVLAANSPQMATCALRPHLIWGPGDRHLAPRLWQRARQGRLVQIGAGTNYIDVTHIDNAVWAHLLAVEKLLPNTVVAGQAYFITDGQPVRCWQWIAQLLHMVGLPPPSRRIPYWLAYSLGTLMEFVYRAARLRGEPVLTRFLAAQLALDHYYQIHKACTHLEYTPLVDRQEGLWRWQAELARGP